MRYIVAASLDGFIAGPNGEYDWIPTDSSVDFAALFADVDTVLLGRHSYDLVRRHGAGSRPWPAGSRVYVFSRTLQQDQHPEVTIVRGGAETIVAGLRRERGSRDIWLFGGGSLFGSLLAAGQVDSVEVTLVPVLLGVGVPLLPGATTRTTLRLRHTHQYRASGMVSLVYDVDGVLF